LNHLTVPTAIPASVDALTAARDARIVSA